MLCLSINYSRAPARSPGVERAPAGSPVGTIRARSSQGHCGQDVTWGGSTSWRQGAHKQTSQHLVLHIINLKQPFKKRGHFCKIENEMLWRVAFWLLVYYFILQFPRVWTQFVCFFYHDLKQNSKKQNKKTILWFIQGLLKHQKTGKHYFIINILNDSGRAGQPIEGKQ